MDKWQRAGTAGSQHLRRSSLLAILALALTAMVLTGCREEDSPLGNVDVMSISSNGLLTVQGWTFDPNLPTSTVNVEVTSDGKAVLPLIPAVKDRPDVARVYPQAGKEHGFYAQVLLPQGSHEVCVRFINYFGTSGFNTVDCRRLTVTNKTPFGRFDSLAVDSGADQIRVKGWAIDPDTSSSVNIHVYNGSNITASAKANLPRPDVAASYPAYGQKRGFDITFDVTPGSHVICVYAIDAQGGPTNTNLGCKVASGV